MIRNPGIAAVRGIRRLDAVNPLGLAAIDGNCPAFDCYDGTERVGEKPGVDGLGKGIQGNVLHFGGVALGVVGNGLLVRTVSVYSNFALLSNY